MLRTNWRDPDVSKLCYKKGFLLHSSEEVSVFLAQFGPPVCPQQIQWTQVREMSTGVTMMEGGDEDNFI